MIDYHEAKYTALSIIERAWLRILLKFHEWDAENETRLIARVRDEVDRGIAGDDELQFYKRRRIGIWNRANAIRARLGIAR